MSKRKGFSLIEILISIAVLSIGILAILGVYPVVLSLNQNAWSTSTALTLAQDKMDEILSKNVTLGTSYQSDEPVQLPSCARRWRGLTVDPYGLQTVSVEVTWKEKNRTRNMTLTSQICP